MRILISITLSLFIATAFAGNIAFKPESDCVNKLKIYIDREGNTYPPSDLYQFNQGLFFNPKQRNDQTSRLSMYFKNDSVGLSKICNSYGIKTNFDTMQGYLLKAYADRINKEVQKGKKIVFLIHGFNSDYESTLNSYAVFRGALSARKDIAIVEVFWDGLTKSPMRIWPKAQSNSVYAGLDIRKILNQVDRNADIIFMTHSLGASVATQAMFNVNKWTIDAQMKIDSISNIIPTPPQKIITLIMLAPAIPGVNTFDDLNRTVLNPTTKNINKIIVGYNSKDIALTKGIGLKEHYGATSLGCNSNEEITKTQATIEAVAPFISYQTFDLSKKPKPRSHNVAGYAQATLFNSFLDAAF